MMAPARDRKRVDCIRLGGEGGGVSHDPESPKKDNNYRLWFSKKSSPKVIYAGMGLIVLLSWMTWSKFLRLDAAAHRTTSEKTTRPDPVLNSHKAKAEADHSLVDFGNRKVPSLILNIGSNSDPIVPRPKDDPCVIAIAFEPMVPHTIKPHPALHVVAAAVTGEDNTTTGGGLATMRFYNDNGISSSLSTPTESSYWNDKEKRRGDGSIRVVPTLSMRSVLQSLSLYPIDFLKTDMQGHDFASVSSAGELLLELGVKRLLTEVYRGAEPSYQGVRNDFCNDWLPYMTKIGYVFEGFMERKTKGYANEQEALQSCRMLKKEDRPSSGLAEYNAKWRHPKVSPSSGKGSSRPYQYGSQYRFPPKEYESCKIT